MQKKYDNAVQVVFLLEKRYAQELKHNIKRYTDFENTTEFLQKAVKDFNKRFTQESDG